MGLERIAFIKQGVQNMYETDQVRPVLDLAAELSGRRYGADHGDDVAHAHHRRSRALVADAPRRRRDARPTRVAATSSAA